MARDKTNKYNYLIDTGASLSIVPPRSCDFKNVDTKLNLSGADGSNIKTYGERLIVVNIGFGITMEHIFTVADVVRPILGIDFLRKFKISVIPYMNTLTSELSNKTLKLDNIDKPKNLPVYNIELMDQRVKDLLKDYPSLYNDEKNPGTVNHNIEHYIITEGVPISVRPRKLSPKMRIEAQNIIERLLKEGTIRPSRSPWGSPIHMVPKKSQDWRLVGDYRLLNTVTKKDSYPLPLLKDFTVNLSGSKVFSTIDLKDAYHQIPIREEDAEKSSIVTPFGSYEYKYMSFGLCGAAQTFQRFIDIVLRDLRDEQGKRLKTFGYLDDILLSSPDEQTHEKHLKILFNRLNEYGLKINTLKCNFFQTKLKFLGHMVSPDGIYPLKDQVEAIKGYSKPSTLKELRRYLGMINFYHQFIPNAAKLLAPLTSLLSCARNTRGNTKLCWTDEANKAFIESKETLAKETILYHFDPTIETAIAVDASDIAIGGVLQQKVGDHWRPVSFFSKKLNKNQRAYSTFSKELYGIFCAIKQFRHYVEGSPFYIITDHKPILNAFHKRTARDISREERYLEYIAIYTTDIRHIQGTNNLVADALSRHLESNFSKENIDDEDGEYNIAAIFGSSHIDIAKLQSEDVELTSILSGELKITPELVNQDGLYYVKINNNLKMFVPSVLRNNMINEYHMLAHQGINATKKYFKSKYFWPNMNKDITVFVKTCINCQKSKITRHNKKQVVEIPQASEKFAEINIDLVGPLPVNRGCKYILTIIDRYSRWVEAIPIPDIKTETVVECLLLHWVARYGVPRTITSDRGAQFTSHMWETLHRILGSKHIHTCAYHPQSNGLIERFHRRLKDSLRAQSDAYPLDWYSKLPFILLSIRTSIREDVELSSSQTVFGSELNLPSDLLSPDKYNSYMDVSTYTNKLRKAMKVMTPVKSRIQNPKIQLDPALQTCTHVFIRNETKKGLEPNYRGPFLVLEKHPDYFTVQLTNRVDRISIDRIKAAFLTEDVLYNTKSRVNEDMVMVEPRMSRYGRIYRQPVRYPN